MSLQKEKGLPPQKKNLKPKRESEAYRLLCREILERDGWRCQGCGRMEDLQVHHIRPRSQLGDDIERNLITLCIGCHQRVHRR
jgi:5-methylcytosine-specific restriction endonuclease McrA